MVEFSFCLCAYGFGFKENYDKPTSSLFAVCHIKSIVSQTIDLTRVIGQAINTVQYMNSVRYLI